MTVALGMTGTMAAPLPTSLLYWRKPANYQPLAKAGPTTTLFVLSDSPENVKYIWGEVSSLVLQRKRVVSHQSRRNLRP